MDTKDSFMFLVLLLLSLGLFGSLSLTYCVWNKQTEVASELQSELHELQKRSEIGSIRNEQYSKLQNEVQDLKNTNSKLQSELADVQNELHKLQSELKDTNSRVHLGASEPSQDKGQLKRNVRHASNDTDTLSATEILNNALSEIMELKQILISYMDCNKNEYNHTKCTLKPRLKGEPGNNGTPGMHGTAGQRGLPGPIGPTGPTGPQGPHGTQGKDGMKGKQGRVGDAGLPGPRGDRGDKGDMGERGLKGDMGPPGPKGETGGRGDMGQKGEPGDLGMKGNQGYKDEKGEQGAAGTPTTGSTTTPTTAPATAPTTALPTHCGGPGWRRVVFLNMTDPSHVCPAGLNLTTYSKRTCGRAHLVVLVVNLLHSVWVALNTVECVAGHRLTNGVQTMLFWGTLGETKVLKISTWMVCL